MSPRTFITRVPWWMTAVWVLTIAGAVLSAAVGLWVNALALVVIAWLSVYGEAQHQRATDAEARFARAEWWNEQNAAVNRRLRMAARYPRADWED